MTDAEIIQALEHCVECDCTGCPNKDVEGRCLEGLPYSMVLGVIQRQQETIERLEKESADKERAYTEEYLLRKEVQRYLKKEQKQFADIREMYSEISCEAIKYFADRLKSVCNGIISHEREHKTQPVSLASAYEDFIEDIDRLLNETAG